MSDKVLRLAARGEGVTESGRFVPLTAPGDMVGGDDAILPGPHHQTPPCRHFPECGGCQLQHVDDAAYADFVSDRIATALRKQGVAPGEILFSKTLDVPSGQNLSAVASFDAGGSPTIDVFANDVTKAPAKGGRISLRHAAAAPEVVVDLGYYPYNRQYSFFSRQYGPVANGQQGDVTTLAGPYDVVVRAASSKARVAAIPRFPISAGMLTNVFVVGKPGESLGFIVQRIAL